VVRNSYTEKLKFDTEKANAISAAARDIAAGYDAEAPDSREVALWGRCAFRLRLFLRSFFPRAFYRPFCQAQEDAIAILERAVLEGGQFAWALWRGGGKTTISERALLWALLYGHRRFAVNVGATDAMSGETIERLRMELCFNETLRRPFRYVTYPLRRLEGNAKRAIGQIFNGERTLISWSASEIVFPTLPPEAYPKLPERSPAAGARVNTAGSRVYAAGITGAIRGHSATLPTGEIIRPDFLSLDDPQTRESAGSDLQTQTRLDIIHGDCLNLAGMDKRITAVCACTVIRPGDLSDRLLDRKAFPAWQGSRVPAITKWPADMSLWERYGELYAEAVQDIDGAPEALADFYAENAEALEAGAEVADTGFQKEGDPSPLVSLMNLRARIGEGAFAAEFQNSPVRLESESAPAVGVADVVAHATGAERGVVPAGMELLTAFVDIHDTALAYAVCAWRDDFTGAVVDYGLFPAQRGGRYELHKVRQTLRLRYKGTDKEGAIRAGLDELTGDLCGRQWQREDGAILRLDLCMMDAGYVPDVVFEVVKHSPWAANLYASRGVFIGPGARPMTEYSRKRGDRIGWQWYVPAPQRGRGVRHLRFDANYWKSFIHARFMVAPGDRGTLTVWGRPEGARGLAEQVTSEYAVRTTANGRVVDEWRARPGITLENHLLDTLVGCAVGASFRGLRVPGSTDAGVRAAREPEALSLAAMQARPGAPRGGSTARPEAKPGGRGRTEPARAPAPAGPGAGPGVLSLASLQRARRGR